MTLTWPWALTAVLLIPLLFAIRWWWRRRRRAAAIRVTSISLVRGALPTRARWTRLIPPALLILGMGVLVIGAARPQATVPVPSKSSTILLALDVSGSMCSTDVKPNRITAAEDAAADFIRSQSGGPRIGLVAFAGTAGLLVPPTDDTQKLLDALTDLTTSRGTAIGQGILASLDAIAEVDPRVAGSGADPTPGGAESGPAPGQDGYAPDAIVLLTDGANTQGVDPQTAAAQAAERRVRVFTIGFGTTNPAPLVCSGNQINSGFTGGGFRRFDSGRTPLMIDEDALRRIADTTGGNYYRAENAGQLKDALGDLPAAFSVVRKQEDIAAWFAGAGGLIVATALALSMWWGRTRTVRAALPPGANSTGAGSRPRPADRPTRPPS